MLREAIVVDCPGRQIIPSYATDFESNFLAPGSKKTYGGHVSISVRIFILFVSVH